MKSHGTRRCQQKESSYLCPPTTLIIPVSVLAYVCCVFFFNLLWYLCTSVGSCNFAPWKDFLDRLQCWGSCPRGEILFISSLLSWWDKQLESVIRHPFVRVHYYYHSFSLFSYESRSRQVIFLSSLWSFVPDVNECILLLGRLLLLPLSHVLCLTLFFFHISAGSTIYTSINRK